MVSSLLKRRISYFKLHKKGFRSLFILGTCLLISFFAELVCNDRPLLLSYKGNFYAPFLKNYPASTFGENYETETHYSEKRLISRIEKEGWILWSPVRFGPSTIDWELTEPTPSAPDSRHLLGTDDRARDVFARLFYGFRLSLLLGLLVASIGACLGIAFASLEMYRGARFDILGQRFTEIISSIPELFILLIFHSLFEPSYLLLLLFMCLTGWMTFADYARVEFLRIRQLDFVTCAKQLGASHTYIVLNHMLPNALGPLLSYFPIRVSTAITCLASLDFLGLGLPSSYPSLGELLLQGKAHLSCWWILLSSFCTLSLTVLLLNFISEGFRDALDPRH